MNACCKVKVLAGGLWLSGLGLGAVGGALAFGADAAVSPAAPATGVDVPARENERLIARLILQLGDEVFSGREQATVELIKLGEEVLPAVRAAVGTRDPEVSQRATRIIRAITELTPERRAEIAALVAKAMAEADYPTAARQQMILARRVRPTIDECINAGNYWQLAGDWAKAVEGYQRAVVRAEEVLKGDPEVDPPPLPPGFDEGKFGGGGGGFGPGAGINGRRGIRGAPGLTDHQKRELSGRHAGLILLIGRIQREMLGDGAGAAKTLAHIVEFVPEFKGEVAGLLPGLAADVKLRRERKEVARDVGRGLSLLNEFEVMDELSVTQERLGRNDEAVLTLARLCTALLHTRDDGVDECLARMTRILPKSAAGKTAEAEALMALTPAPGAAAAKTLGIQVLGVEGALTLDDKPVGTNIAIGGLGAGDSRIAFRPAKGKGAFEVKAAFAPGLNHHLFINCDSPVAWTMTNLGDPKLGAISTRDLGRMADGRWVAAQTVGSRIYTVTSRDLITWDAPAALPHNGIANNTDPALIVDDQGGLWLAWFSNRFSLQPRSSAGYQLWLTHSKDARTWSPPRSIAADTGGWPMGALQWQRTADGKFRLSWRAASATAASPGEIARLEPIEIAKGDRPWPMDPDVVQDAAGNFHMVFNDVLRGVVYSTSADGKKWSDPVVMMEKLPQSGFAALRIFIQGKKAAIIYRDHSACYVRRGTLADLSVLSPPVMLSDMPACWKRVDGEMIGVTSGEAPWLLRSKAGDLFEAK